jgi:CubicO group peptidase (beta-lactamase class C family)
MDRTRRHLLRSAFTAAALLTTRSALAQATAPVPPTLATALEKAEALKPLRTVVVAHRGQIVAEHGYRGYTSDDPTSIMSASKSIISALVGIAIDKAILDGPDQRIATILDGDMPEKGEILACRTSRSAICFRCRPVCARHPDRNMAPGSAAPTGCAPCFHSRSRMIPAVA